MAEYEVSDCIRTALLEEVGQRFRAYLRFVALGAQSPYSAFAEKILVAESILCERDVTWVYASVRSGECRGIAPRRAQRVPPRFDAGAAAVRTYVMRILASPRLGLGRSINEPTRSREVAGENRAADLQHLTPGGDCFTRDGFLSERYGPFERCAVPDRQLRR